MKKVFLGGTCADSEWRERLIPLLKINYFNPVVEDWTEECMKREIEERKTCDFCLYVITPRMQGVYSIAEVVDDSNKRPNKTVFCVLSQDKGDSPCTIKSFTKGELKSLESVKRMIIRNGSNSFGSLEEVAEFLNTK